MKLRFISQGWQRSWRRLPVVCFILSLTLTLLLDSFIPIIAPIIAPGEHLNGDWAIAQTSRPEIRGVWMTNNDLDVMRNRAKLQEAIGHLKRLNFNTIYPVVWNSGYALYPSDVAQQAGIQPFVYKGDDGQDILADAIDQAHRQGLLAIPWFEFGFMAPPTSELALKYAHWLTQRQDSSQSSVETDGEVAWLNPLRPEVQQFITDLVLEVVTKYDADGIQFDDHMSLPNEFGYDRYTIDLYRKETKKEPPSDFQNPAWVSWRANKITAFMAKLNKAVKEKKPKAIFSVAPNYYDFAYKFHLQDWLTWIRKDIVDELIVQVYRSDLQSFVDRISSPEIQESQKKIPTGIGILTGLRNNPASLAQIQSQVQAAQSRNLGVSFFYYNSLWDYGPEPVAQRQSGFQTLFPTAALRTTSD
ncbi:glycoside hydrolase family 10 protein [Pseudanabaena sp. PCC 6802]|uniref:glycoside hydrolase family 10 protein n=1 Tax=Pseudanabaena sp. PCC 6802 TaxID=118173 RepID=UPI000347A435|nr:glycoside hydrolase family 10 protein [Pseudanabaena sp. PCC 6802]